MAKIDLATEEIFRKILYAAIKDDETAFEEQLESFGSAEVLLAACVRATEVATLIIAEQYKGRPTSPMITRLADFAAAVNEEWIGITAAHFDAFIHAILEDTPLDTILPTGVAIRVPFVLAAQLLVQFETPDEKAFDYLDRLWEVLETR